MGPEGLLTANMPDKGSTGTVALGIPGRGGSQVLKRQGRHSVDQLLKPTLLDVLELLMPMRRR